LNGFKERLLRSKSRRKRHRGRPHLHMQATGNVYVRGTHNTLQLRYLMVDTLSYACCLELYEQLRHGSVRNLTEVSTTQPHLADPSEQHPPRASPVQQQIHQAASVGARQVMWPAGHPVLGRLPKAQVVFLVVFCGHNKVACQSSAHPKMYSTGTA
jgi:hypothetical protein